MHSIKRSLLPYRRRNIRPVLPGIRGNVPHTSATVRTPGKRLLWRTDATSVSHGSLIFHTCR